MWLETMTCQRQDNGTLTKLLGSSHGTHQSGQSDVISPDTNQCDLFAQVRANPAQILFLGWAANSDIGFCKGVKRKHPTWLQCHSCHCCTKLLHERCMTASHKLTPQHTQRFRPEKVVKLSLFIAQHHYEMSLLSRVRVFNAGQNAVDNN